MDDPYSRLPLSSSWSWLRYGYDGCLTVFLSDRLPVDQRKDVFFFSFSVVPVAVIIITILSFFILSAAAVVLVVVLVVGRDQLCRETQRVSTRLGGTWRVPFSSAKKTFWLQ